MTGLNTCQKLKVTQRLSLKEATLMYLHDGHLKAMPVTFLCNTHNTASVLRILNHTIFTFESDSYTAISDGINLLSTSKFDVLYANPIELKQITKLSDGCMACAVEHYISEHLKTLVRLQADPTYLERAKDITGDNLLLGTLVTAFDRELSVVPLMSVSTANTIYLSCEKSEGFSVQRGPLVDQLLNILGNSGFVLDGEVIL